MESSGKGMPWWGGLVGLAGLGSIGLGMYALMRNRDKNTPEAALQRVAEFVQLVDEVCFEILEAASKHDPKKGKLKGIATSTLEAAAIAFVHSVARETKKDVEQATKAYDEWKDKANKLEQRIVVLRVQHNQSARLFDEVLRTAAAKKRLPASVAKEIAQHVTVIKKVEEDWRKREDAASSGEAPAEESD